MYVLAFLGMPSVHKRLKGKTEAIFAPDHAGDLIACCNIMRTRLVKGEREFVAYILCTLQAHLRI